MAETETKPPAESQDDAEALERPENNAGGSPQDSPDNPAGQTDNKTGQASEKSANASGQKSKKPGGIKQLVSRFNIYLLFFGLILIITGILIATAYFQSKKTLTTNSLKTQGLTQATLDQVANSDSTVGSSQQILNIQSNAVFAGKVLVRGGLEVAGNLQVGGTVALNDLAVVGSTQLGQVQINKNLTVAGDNAVQGAATIAKSLQVNGNGSFGGPLTAPQITTPNLQLNGDLVLTHHIVAGGSTPGRSSGPALGSGGTVSVGGSDIAGSVSINTGGSPSAGCFVTINFTGKYNNTPHILITPIGSSAAGLAYYVNRGTTYFSICVAGVPPAQSSFSFDYFVID